MRYSDEEWEKASISPDDIQGDENQVWHIKMLHRIWNGEQSASLSSLEGVTKYVLAEARIKQALKE